MIEELNKQRIEKEGNAPIHPNERLGYGGLTKREFMATHLLSSLIDKYQDSGLASKLAVQFADSLIKELNSN